MLHDTSLANPEHKRIMQLPTGQTDKIFIAAHAAATGIESGSADFIYETQALFRHLKDFCESGTKAYLKDVGKEWKRILKPGGKIRLGGIYASEADSHREFFSEIPELRFIGFEPTGNSRPNTDAIGSIEIVKVNEQKESVSSAVKVEETFVPEYPWQKKLMAMIEFSLKYRDRSLDTPEGMVRAADCPGGGLIVQEVYDLFKRFGHVEIFVNEEWGTSTPVFSVESLEKALYVHNESKRIYFRKEYVPYVEVSGLFWSDRNNPIRETLGFMFGRWIGANTAETVITSKHETFSALSLTTPQKYLPNKTVRKANAVHLVLNTFLRKFDYAFNYIQRAPIGESFLEFDYDQILLPLYTAEFWRYLDMFRRYRFQMTGWTDDDFDEDAIVETVRKIEEMNLSGFFKHFCSNILPDREFRYVDEDGEAYDYYADLIEQLQKHRLTLARDVFLIYRDVTEKSLFSSSEEVLKRVPVVIVSGPQGKGKEALVEMLEYRDRDVIDLARSRAEVKYHGREWVSEGKIVVFDADSPQEEARIYKIFPEARKVYVIPYFYQNSSVELPDGRQFNLSPSLGINFESRPSQIAAAEIVRSYNTTLERDAPLVVVPEENASPYSDDERLKISFEIFRDVVKSQFLRPGPLNWQSRPLQYTSGSSNDTGREQKDRTVSKNNSSSAVKVEEEWDVDVSSSPVTPAVTKAEVKPSSYVQIRWLERLVLFLSNKQLKEFLGLIDTAVENGL
ncbi:MAG: class I SAM-dependent methyltransferase, partial [Candidatus Omnitrophica bacterium]|nr:class I SAM-dependent methyltransferase [Candidatus Omnitrophota bacterium]